jgi:uncharacterized small protein (DUF1192 family)
LPAQIAGLEAEVQRLHAEVARLQKGFSTFSTLEAEVQRLHAEVAQLQKGFSTFSTPPSSNKGLVGKWHPAPAGPSASIDGLTIEFRQDGTFIRAASAIVQHSFEATSQGNREISRADSFYQEPGFMGQWRMAGKVLEFGEGGRWQSVPFSWIDANHVNFMGTQYERVN